MIDRSRRWAGVLLAVLPLIANAATAQTAGTRESLFEPKLYEADKDAIVITDLAGWSHPTKPVFEKYKLKLTSVELRWNRKFPVFHVASFAFDPSSSQTHSYFTPILYDLLKANANWSYEIISDDFHDGYMIGWNPKDKAMKEELVEDGLKAP